MPQTFDPRNYKGIVPPADGFNASYPTTISSFTRKRTADLTDFHPINTIADENLNETPWIKRSRFEFETTDQFIKQNEPCSESMEMGDDAEDKSALPAMLPENICAAAKTDHTAHQEQTVEHNPTPGCTYLVSTYNGTRHHRRQWGYMDHYFSAGHWF